MSKIREHITVFEHETLRFDKGEKRISKEQYHALQKYYGIGIPFYNLCYNGVQFNSYVGAIQVGKTLIEVLPKSDKENYTESKWRDILIGMLKVVAGFDIKTSSESSLRIRPNTILDLYIEMFIREVEYLMQLGLIKQYRKKEANIYSLKGRLQFAKNIQYNLIHQERFFVHHTHYGVEHKLHLIIYKTLRLLKLINTRMSLQSRIGALLLNFPEMTDIKIGSDTFEKIVYNRKSQGYKKAMEIARLLLLRYHPDISRGQNHVLALMFDMNSLWEQFVFVSLRKHKAFETSISSQTSKYFWKPEQGSRTKIRPDIVVNKDREGCIVLDTKWKNLCGKNPSPNDLRQMYVYHEYYHAKKVALVYPGESPFRIDGSFLDPELGSPGGKECSVITIPVISNIKDWQFKIYSEFKQWMEANN